MINIVIPMAGAGSRFSKAGYLTPKPFIDIKGKPMIQHVLDNLFIEGAVFTLLVRREHYELSKALFDQLSSDYPISYVFVELLTEGATMTVLHAHRVINNDVPLLIANCDQVVDMNILDFVNDAFERNLDGSILTFANQDPKWSYAALDKHDLVTHVKEKHVISEHATVGIYLFTYGRLFVESALDLIVRNERVNNEFYVCPVYNYAIQYGAKIGIYEIPANSMHGIGTPGDLQKYTELLGV